MTRAPVKPQPLSSSVWRLGAYHVPCYLVRGAKASAVFEAGLSATAPLVLAQLDELGVGRGEVRYVVVSHAHSDHACGQAALMAGLPQATLLMTEGSRKILAKQAVTEHFTMEDDYASRQVSRREGLAGLDPPPRRLPLLPDPLELVAPGDELDLGGVSLRFLSADGHAPHGIVGLVPQEMVVFASDSAGYVTAQGPAYPMFFVSYSMYQETMAGLARLGPRVLGLGHQRCLFGEEVGPYLDLTARRLAADREEIRRWRAQGLEPEELARRLCDKYYHGELTIFLLESALNGCRLLVRRCLED